MEVRKRLEIAVSTYMRNYQRQTWAKTLCWQKLANYDSGSGDLAIW